MTEFYKKLRLDSYNLEIPLLQSKRNIQDLLQKHGIQMEIPMDDLIIIKSRILSLDMNFYISFRFKHESLIAVSMSPEGYLEGRRLHDRYRKIQKVLKDVLGRPGNIVQMLYNYLNPDGSSFYWVDDGVRITHVLQERFGMEEIITFNLSKGKFIQPMRILNEICWWIGGVGA